MHSATRRRSPPERLRDFGVARRQLHGVHGNFDLPIEFPGVRGLDLVLHPGLLGQQLFHLGVAQRLAEAGVDLVVALNNARVDCDRFFDVAQHVLVGIELRLLRHEADGKTAGQLGFAFEILVDAGHDSQQGALARAVAAQHADLGAGIKRQPDILEHFALGDFLGQTIDLIDVLLAHGRPIRFLGFVDPCEFCIVSGDRLP